MRRVPQRSPSLAVPRSVPAAAAARALVLGLATACAAACSQGARSNSSYRYPREVAYGRPSTCPDVRLPPLRDGNVSPDAARCSFADANGSKVSQFAGKVLAEGGPGDPGTGVADVKISVHAVPGAAFDPANPGPRVAHATTDAQGNYSLRGLFIPGDYALVVREPTGEALTYRVVRVEPEAMGALRDLRVVIPIDPRLKAEAAEPPLPHPDARLHPHTPAATATATDAKPSATPPTDAKPTDATSKPAPTDATPRKPAPAGLRMRPPAP